jgi:hypothetical protein
MGSAHILAVPFPCAPLTGRTRGSRIGSTSASSWNRSNSALVFEIPMARNPILPSLDGRPSGDRGWT